MNRREGAMPLGLAQRYLEESSAFYFPASPRTALLHPLTSSIRTTTTTMSIVPGIAALPQVAEQTKV
jgi:hypothetical protein